MVVPQKPKEPIAPGLTGPLLAAPLGATDLWQFVQFAQVSAEGIAKKLRALSAQALDPAQGALVQESLARCERLTRHAKNFLGTQANLGDSAGLATFDVQHVASVAIEACSDLLLDCSVSLRNEAQPRMQCVGNRELLHRLLCAMLEDAIANKPSTLDLCICAQGHGVAFTLSAAPRQRSPRLAIAPSAVTIRLALALGGQISAHHGEASAVTALLPLQRAAAALPQPNECALHILAAEDNPGASTILEAILASLGHQIAMVRSGEAAVVAAREKVFDLIILDLGLPGLDGLGACAAIRCSGGPNQNAPIIAITAFAAQSVLDRAAEVGMDAVLPKPIEIGRLIATMRLLLTPRSVDAAEIEDVQDHEHGDEAADQPNSHSQSPARVQRASP